MFSVTPRSKVKHVAKMLKAIHAQESKRSARESPSRGRRIAMKLKEAAKKVEDKSRNADILRFSQRTLEPHPYQ